jgi:hypothetical protein
MALPHHTKQPINLKIFLSPEASAANLHQKRGLSTKYVAGRPQDKKTTAIYVSLPFHGWTCVPVEAIASCSAVGAVVSGSADARA